MQFQAPSRITILCSVMLTVRRKQASGKSQTERWIVFPDILSCSITNHQPISLTILPKYLSSNSKFFQKEKKKKLYRIIILSHNYRLLLPAELFVVVT
jgi:hypothetical protein